MSMRVAASAPRGQGSPGSTLMVRFLAGRLEDVSQIMIGAFALAVPVSFSEEAWDLGPFR